MNYLLMTFLQILPTEGLEKAADTSVLNGVLVTIIITLGTIAFFLFKTWKSCEKEKLEIVEEKSKNIENLLIEKNKSELHTLKVLNDVTSVLSMAEKVNENDTEKIIKIIDNLKELLIQEFELIEGKIVGKVSQKIDSIKLKNQNDK